MAAAHAQGVLHRDLKPANIMIDSRGELRVTDFGLAAIAEQLKGDEIRNGTPAYMAPEQLTGTEVSAQSDLYAVGLILYEMFTGKLPFHADTIAEMTRLRQESRVTNPSTLIGDLDKSRRASHPALPRTRSQDAPGVGPCAVRESSRGRSAGCRACRGSHAVSRSGGRGRPNGSAFAEGGDSGAGGDCRGDDRVLHHDSTRAFNEPGPAGESARGVDRQGAGYRQEAWVILTAPADRTSNFLRRLAMSRSCNRRGATWRNGRVSLRNLPRLSAIGTVSPRRRWPAERISSNGEASVGDPPVTVPGMLTVVMDMDGSLRRFAAVPPEREAPPAESTEPPDWAPLFSAAHLDPAKFTAVAPEWSPQVVTDTRAAWTGFYRDRSDLPVRVEAAAYHNRAVYFQVLWPWVRGKPALLRLPIRFANAAKLRQLLHLAPWS